MIGTVFLSLALARACNEKSSVTSRLITKDGKSTWPGLGMGFVMGLGLGTGIGLGLGLGPGLGLGLRLA